MTTDLTTETLITLAEVGELLPSSRRVRVRDKRGRRTGHLGPRGRVTIGCVLRWIVDGVRVASNGPDGEIEVKVVRLEGVRVGGRWLTSREALARFAAAQTPPAPTSTPIRSPTARERASERAARELERIGILRRRAREEPAPATC